MLIELAHADGVDLFDFVRNHLARTLACHTTVQSLNALWITYSTLGSFTSTGPKTESAASPTLAFQATKPFTSEP